jgi:hypothetical protein
MARNTPPTAGGLQGFSNFEPLIAMLVLENVRPQSRPLRHNPFANPRRGPCAGTFSFCFKGV